MKKTSKSLLSAVFLAVSIIFFILGKGTNELDIIMAAVLLAFTGLLMYSLLSGYRSIVLSAFLVCFFTFVLGEWGIKFLMGVSWGEKFSNPVREHVLMCVFISILSIWAGVVIGETGKKRKGKVFDMETYRKEASKYENVVRILFYITLVFNAAVILEKVIFVQSNTYIDLYTSYSSKLPYIVYKLGQCNDFLMYAYMAIMPDKKSAKTPLAIYFILYAISIFSGVRGTGVKVAILIIVYCIYRNYTDEEKWLKKKHFVMLAIAAPVAIVLLSLYNFWRSGLAISYTGFVDEFFNFFVTQGGSINIIGYEKVYHELLPKTNTSYLFGPIISLYKHGFIGKLIQPLLGQSFIKYGGNTIGAALYENNLGATITYLVTPYNYLAGVGLGTQYIAEACADFGYVGVAITNLVLGFLLTRCTFVYFKKWYLNIFTVYMLYHFLGIGRTFALTFVPYWVSPLNWGIIGIIFLLGKIKLKKYGGIPDESALDL